GRFAGPDSEESPACLSAAGAADAHGRRRRTAGKHLTDREHHRRQTVKWTGYAGPRRRRCGATVEIPAVLPERRTGRDPNSDQGELQTAVAHFPRTAGRREAWLRAFLLLPGALLAIFV